MYGNKWETIGKILERTSTNVKDKFKQLGGKNYEKRTNELNLVHCLKLLKYIQDYLSNDEQKFEIFNFAYKFSTDLEKKEKQLYKIDEEKMKMKIDDSAKDEQSKIVIKNLLSKIINKEVLQKIAYDEIEISWSFISIKIRVFSADDCRNNWFYILRLFNLDKKCEIKKDLKMIQKYYLLI
jgi:hypothetical protein